MNPDSREETVVAAACARLVAERRAFLDGACSGDVALRARVEALLAAAPARCSVHGKCNSDDGFGRKTALWVL